MPEAPDDLAAFARAFEEGAIAPAAFHHLDHLRLAWVYLEEEPTLAAATGRMQAALRPFATAAGAAAKYSDALTARWVAALAAARAARPDADFDELLRAYPRLVEKGLVDAR
jgi:hypothetical protein